MHNGEKDQAAFAPPLPFLKNSSISTLFAENIKYKVQILLVVEYIVVDTINHNFPSKHSSTTTKMYHILFAKKFYFSRVVPKKPIF